MTTDEGSFTLFRFEWSVPGRLDVARAWSGMDKRDVSKPVLSLHEPAGTQRLRPVSGVLGNPRKWSAVFEWNGDPSAIEGADLTLDDALTVKLPTSDFRHRRRRFERVQLPVVGLEQAAGTSGPRPDTDVLAIHAAMVATWEEATEAQEEVARLRVENERVRGDARRDRARRESESARLHEAMAILRRMAAEALQREREAADQAAGRIEVLERRLSTAEAEGAHVRQRAEAAGKDHDEVIERERLQRAKLERLESTVGHLRSDLADAQERTRRATEDVERQRRKLAAVLDLVRDALGAADASDPDAGGSKSQVQTSLP